MSHLLDVDGVMFRVGAHETDVDHAVGVVGLHNQPVIIALDVEHDPVVPRDARIPILRFNLSWSIPVLFFDLSVPSQKRLLRVGMALPKRPESLLGYDPHRNIRCSQTEYK